MHGVAAEIAIEVRVLFEHGDVHAIARKQVAKHHSGWASADDAAGGI
jgi:hypothetical protein